MKPIFEEEKLFIEEKIGFKIPNDCWRDGKSIYLNADINTKILQFDIKSKEITVKKNKIEEVLSKYKNKTIQEEIYENNERLNRLEEKSVKETIECINKYSDYNFRVSDSGGKDSTVAMVIFRKAMDRLNRKDYDMDFFNTTNDTGDTYMTVKENMMETVIHQTGKRPNYKVADEYFRRWIHNPEMGWHDWIVKKKNYYLPSIMVRNCCSTYKEGKLKDVIDKKANVVLFLGMRKYESSKRSNYDWYLNDAMDKMFEETGQNKYKLNVPRNWIRFLPIVEWEDKDVWLYMIRENIRFNRMYRLGFNRIGCLLCPYASDYVDLLIEKYYPFLWNRWALIVEKNYELYDVGNRLKWTKEEYVQEGKWKQATSKANEYITKKPTEERVKVVAELYGISEDLAVKYFKQNCSCGKKLNPDEVSMYLKLYGRYEGKEDNRTYLCKKCLCENMNISKDTYEEKVREYRNQGCELF